MPLVTIALAIFPTILLAAFVAAIWPAESAVRGSLVEALELVLPPIVNEIKQLPQDLQAFYMYLRQAFGPFAQGPVALVSRHGDECVFSVDALGLRPLWHIESTDAHVFSSEAGVVPVAETVAPTSTSS